MAAMVQVQTYQHSRVVPMPQARPSSASGMRSAQAQPIQPFSHTSSQQNGSATFQGASGEQKVYRGNSGPVQPYAFTSTPSLNSSAQIQPHRPSTPATALAQASERNVQRIRHLNTPSISNIASTAAGDLAIPPSYPRRASTTPRPQSSNMVTAPTAQATYAQVVQAGPTKISPERYRRSVPRPTDLSGQSARSASESQVTISRDSSFPPRPSTMASSSPSTAFDDMELHRGDAHDKRFRRRSMPTLDAALVLQPLKSSDIKVNRQFNAHAHIWKDTKLPTNPVLFTPSPGKAQHARNDSSDSVTSRRSNASRPSSSTNRSTGILAQQINPTSSLSSHDSDQSNPKNVAIPPRNSSAEVTKRVVAPSPLSNPVITESDQENIAPGAPETMPTSSQAAPIGAVTDSLAVKRLYAIKDKGGKLKSKTSRLRRALSFGSAAEFKRSEATDSVADGDSSVKIPKSSTPADAYAAQQARIAQKQEAAGLGNNIYGGKKFTSSSDSISISSTASSASIMIRTMGRNMKRSTRSLVGLFRPKSVIGVPAADAALPEAGQAAVSMITVEADREVRSAGTDSRPATVVTAIKVKRSDLTRDVLFGDHSADAERRGSMGPERSTARKSIVGGELERAEVLAAVRKGILKRSSASPTPSSRPSEVWNAAPQLTDSSPNSSAPSTPKEDSLAHRRGGSVAIGNEDYFMTALRLRRDSRVPGTPASVTKRNATFSPRVIFYDTWPSQEYDRRGDIATCNRLTPMLAQQIKEELNSFKMEMEVHENSKIYTHFF